MHVPEGTALSRAQASSGGTRDVPVRQELADRLLKVSFPGQSGTVAWRLEFAGASVVGQAGDETGTRRMP